MKKILLILITLALATHAHAMTDAEMKALLTGTWTNHCDDKTIVFQADGKWQVGADDIDPYYKWDIPKRGAS